MVAVLACSQTPGRASGPGNGFPYRAGRSHPGFLDEAAILGMVSAVNAPSGQVDTHVRPVDVGCPVTHRLGIPAGHPPRGVPRLAAEDEHFMPVRDEGAGEQSTYLPAPARDNNLQTIPVAVLPAAISRAPLI